LGVPSTFGYYYNDLFTPIGDADSFSPVGTLVVPSITLADLGASSFNNTLAFRGNGNVGGNQEIRFNTISAVPEPSFLLVGLGALGLGAMRFVARRRQS